MLKLVDIGHLGVEVHYEHLVWLFLGCENVHILLQFLRPSVNAVAINFIDINPSFYPGQYKKILLLQNKTSIVVIL